MHLSIDSEMLERCYINQSTDAQVLGSLIHADIDAFRDAQRATFPSVLASQEVLASPGLNISLCAARLNSRRSAGGMRVRWVNPKTRVLIQGILKPTYLRLTFGGLPKP